MIKEQLFKLLEVVELECKNGSEDSYYEEHREEWIKHHTYIKKLRLDPDPLHRVPALKTSMYPSRLKSPALRA